MPGQTSFLGFHFVDTEGLQAVAPPNNFMEVTGGDPYIPIDGADPYRRLININVILQQARILPIFAITSNVVGNYRSLAAELGFDDRIVFDLGSITSNISQLADQITASSRDLIGLVQNETGLRLGGSYFNYVA
jgi:hypothetical protein